MNFKLSDTKVYVQLFAQVLLRSIGASKAADNWHIGLSFDWLGWLSDWLTPIQVLLRGIGASKAAQRRLHSQISQSSES